MKLRLMAALFKNDGAAAPSQPRTDVYKVMNSAYHIDGAATDSSHFTASVESMETLSSESASSAGGCDDLWPEAVIRGLRSSDRLIFDPVSTSSITENASGAAAFDGALAMSMESEDPYADFRRSMEEMVLANGVEDGEWLEEMLRWFLDSNGKSTHGVILNAFLDLLAGLASPAPAPSPACSTVQK